MLTVTQAQDICRLLKGMYGKELWFLGHAVSPTRNDRFCVILYVNEGTDIDQIPEIDGEDVLVEFKTKPWLM